MLSVEQCDPVGETPRVRFISRGLDQMACLWRRHCLFDRARSECSYTAFSNLEGSCAPAGFDNLYFQLSGRRWFLSLPHTCAGASSIASPLATSSQEGSRRWKSQPRVVGHQNTRPLAGSKTAEKISELTPSAPLKIPDPETGKRSRLRNYRRCVEQRWPSPDGARWRTGVLESGVGKRSRLIIEPFTIP